MDRKISQIGSMGTDAGDLSAFNPALSVCNYQSWDLPSDYELVRPCYFSIYLYLLILLKQIKMICLGVLLTKRRVAATKHPLRLAPEIMK